MIFIPGFVRSPIVSSPRFHLAAALLAAAGLKVWLINSGAVPFNSDEAVVALMARHILQGELPVFFYGQAYMGSLDAFLIAAGFALFGEQVWVIRLVQSLLYLVLIACVFALGRAAFGRWQVGAAAAWLMAVPTVNVSLYTTISLGGYGEALLAGSLLLLIAFHIRRQAERRGLGSTFPWWCLWGFLSGLGFWSFGLSLVFTIPTFGYLAWLLSGTGREDRTATLRDQLIKSAKFLAVLIAGFFLGSFPLWFFAIQNGPAVLLFELRGGAIAGIEEAAGILVIGQHIMNLLLLGSTVILGMRPPWDAYWLALPMIPFVLVFWMTVAIHAFKNRPKNPYRVEKVTLGLVVLVLFFCFVFSPFGADPSGRYFLPLAVPFALFAADMILASKERLKGWVYGLLVFLLVFHAAGTWQSVAKNPPGLTSQFYAPTRLDHGYDEALIQFLRDQGETRGYTTYWVSYPLAFLSQEELIFVPALPYHLDFRYTARDNRYASYQKAVEQASSAAYITANHPALDAHLRQRFDSLGVSWEEKALGDYRVYFALSRVVLPEEVRPPVASDLSMPAGRNSQAAGAQGQSD
jgi:hypothetical protein